MHMPLKTIPSYYYFLQGCHIIGEYGNEYVQQRTGRTLTLTNAYQPAQRELFWSQFQLQAICHGYENTHMNIGQENKPFLQIRIYHSIYLRWISTLFFMTDNSDKGEVRTWGVRLVLQTSKRLMTSFWSLWTSAQRKVWTYNYYSGQRLTAITIHQYGNRAPGVRTKIEGLHRCKNLWSFSLFSSYYFPWL